MIFSTMTTAPSTIIPKSTAPSDRRFAGMPVNFIIVKAKSIEMGIVVATTSAERTLPIKKIRTMMTIEKPSNNVRETVSIV